ncbi:hypothetical protein D3C87_1545900 [compost metagenome]
MLLRSRHTKSARIATTTNANAKCAIWDMFAPNLRQAEFRMSFYVTPRLKTRALLQIWKIIGGNILNLYGKA